ncbi:MAG: alpha/beta hydrolase, partial [Luminiphilus sp.]
MAGYERIPYLILFQESAGYKDTYAGPMDQVVLKAHLLKPKDQPADTVVILMHPIGGGEYLPMTVALAKAGCHVIYCQSRYPNNDSALIMEKVALDMAACVRDAKERLGYSNVVLAGWSGGAALSLFYQSQAESPSVVATPAGEPPDLTAAELIPVDGMLLL